MSTRVKSLLRRVPKRESEAHITVNPLESSTTNTQRKRPLLSDYDYQAPETADSLAPNSKWLIVRHNLHKIRSWGMVRRVSAGAQPFQDWYVFFQMKRELKRAEEQIRGLQYRADFRPVREFYLPVDETHVRRYNVSHVRPDDGIYYAGLGSDPIVLQCLLYYFSKECAVPYNSIFYQFLYDVNAVLHTNRQRIHRVVMFRKVALVMTLAITIFIGIMFFSLILSAWTTTWRLGQMYGNDRHRI